MFLTRCPLFVPEAPANLHRVEPVAKVRPVGNLTVLSAVHAATRGSLVVSDAPMPKENARLHLEQTCLRIVTFDGGQ